MESNPPGSDATKDEEAPDVATAADPVTSYWRLEPSDRGAPSRGSRVADLFLTLAALGALYVLSVVDVAGRALATSERLGYQLGIVIFGLVIGLVARWLYRRNRDAGGPIARMFAPWVLFGAFVVMLPTVGDLATRKPPDPTSALRVSAAYTITGLDQDVLAQVEAHYREGQDVGLGGMTIRQVEAADGSLSFLMVFDGTFAPDTDLSEAALGVGDAAGADPRLETIEGHAVAIVTTAEQSLISWIESPFMLVVIGADEPTARDVAAAVLVTPPR